jgi:UDP-N-acetylglucosamine diphosphorylase / glucose-1-phosphate thymidylyltransferase / UDP-N-acetylgalactosamine diphosphorylase / glucosamine-1-phosphate N-acetyltransferase / galactosamine-1-phosphate N-acetyltransferase
MTACGGNGQALPLTRKRPIESTAMRICIYEDSGVALLEPLTLTRPAFALWCGARTLLDRQRAVLGADAVGLWVRPELVELCRCQYADLPVNDEAWLRQGPVAFVNARWLPSDGEQVDAASIGRVGGQIAYAALDAGAAPSEPLDAWLASWRGWLPEREAGGVLLDYLWDYVDQNGEMLCRDELWFSQRSARREPPPQVGVVGPVERLLLADDAALEPFVTADTRHGPVLIDRGAVVHSFSRLEGPCYLGPGTQIYGAKIRAGTTLGPECRVGGEVEASILQGFCNKYHDGFLGHSYVGEWVNLAAGTQTSDLRNDYDTVRVFVAGQRRATGRTKIGSYLGDHTKTALGSLLNTGSAIGAFANLLPSGTLLPPVVPSFCQVNRGQLQEVWDLRKLFTTAATVMRRRGLCLTDQHKDLYYTLYERTADGRRKAIREGEIRRLRRSV